MTSRFAQNFRDSEAIPALDMDACIGQRAESYRFTVVNRITGYSREVTPNRDRPPVLTHNVQRTIKRTLSPLWFEPQDAADINIISDEIVVEMYVAGEWWPLGTYTYSDDMELVSTGGNRRSTALYDLGFIVDQLTDRGFPANTSPGVLRGIPDLVAMLLDGLPITYTIEHSPYTSPGSWRAGTRRGYIAEQLAVDGDYLAPWFDNTNVMRWRRNFDPATAVPTFDFDGGNKVLREQIINSNNLITAPNRFIVISNGTNDMSIPIYGSYDVPASAPHSIANRGFVVPEVIDRQLDGGAQAGAVARNIGMRQTLFQQVELLTAPDPRHDSYDVIRWQGVNWLEINWSLTLSPGAPMQHILRRAYA